MVREDGGRFTRESSSWQQPQVTPYVVLEVKEGVQGAGTHRDTPLAGHPWHPTLPDESSWAGGSRVASRARCTCIP